MNLLERFIKYAKVHTTSDPENDAVLPSAKREFDLARLLEEELIGIGMKDVRVSDQGYVYAVLPATEGYENAPSVGFIAHMDTSPDFSGENVNVIVHENYQGEDIALGKYTLSTADFPHLQKMVGKTLLTADGSTLLGADDKAGIAEIVTVCERLIKSGAPHGRIAVGFTPDEEIGKGADGFEVDAFGCDFAYTVDGGLPGEVTYETFNAAAAVFTVHGLSVHPGSAKDTMINASLVAMEINSMLPALDIPAATSGREGFFHLCSMSGDVTDARLEYIVRDHNDTVFEYRKHCLVMIAERINKKYGEGVCELELHEQYRNMRSVLDGSPMCLDIAIEATKAKGLEVYSEPMRGGTDGARLSFMGLPTPNLGTGGCAFHGPFEHIALEDMETCCEIIEEIINRVAVTER